MRTQIRIVGGALRGRKLTCTVDANLRPTPQRVREALFNILGDAVPGRPFYDVFAGTGVVGIEALSRGASAVTFVERDFRLAGQIERHLREFAVADRGTLARADVYRWAERFEPPAGPVNVFFSPPFADFERRPEALEQALARMQQRLHPGSVVVLQSEQHSGLAELPGDGWEPRRYGRNELLIWVAPERP
jgi:16S rRNA (guanine966-N2)-methyltransferase